jgi:UDP-N-acetylglucosamine acyltransferase
MGWTCSIESTDITVRSLSPSFVGTTKAPPRRSPHEGPHPQGKRRIGSWALLSPKRCALVSIHPLALVSPSAKLGANVSVGPFSIIEDHAEVGDDCQLESRVVIKQGVKMGPRNRVFEGTVVGGLPQHIRIPETVGGLEIGSDNILRENVTIHRALHGGGTTTLGSHNLIMVGVHIAHDCHVGNHTIFANNALLAGHVTVGDRAYISGAVAVHQFCRIGKLAMVGGHARVTQDIPPYVTVDGMTGLIVGLNLIGLRRNGFTSDEITELKAAYRLIYRSGQPWNMMLVQLAEQVKDGPAKLFHEFLSQGSRGFVQERRMPPRSTIKLRSSEEETALANDAAPIAAQPTLVAPMVAELRAKAG